MRKAFRLLLLCLAMLVMAGVLSSCRTSRAARRCDCPHFGSEKGWF